MSTLGVQSGSIVVLRVFDVAYEIDLARAEALWSTHTGSAGSRRKLSQAPSKAVAFDVPPVVLPLGPVTVQTENGAAQGEALARLYDFGVISLALRFNVHDCPWSAFTDQLNTVDRAIGAASETVIWQTLLERLRAPLHAALERPTTTGLQEDYLFGIVHQWNEASVSAASVLERVDLVPLLSGEQRALSEAARNELLRHRHSYYADDLVVLTWDRAFIYEPRGDSDVADVLEVANAQLLELRYYDEWLDDELPHMYDLVDEARRKPWLVAPRRFAHLARHLYTLVAEVTELTEKVDNALQVTEDVYLARVYSAALELMRVPRLAAAVDRKLEIVRDTYAALYDEAATTRGELLELAIVLLIVIEIVLALVRH
jgi:hypothetical protein